MQIYRKLKYDGVYRFFIRLNKTKNGYDYICVGDSFEMNDGHHSCGDLLRDVPDSDMELVTQKQCNNLSYMAQQLFDYIEKKDQ